MSQEPSANLPQKERLILELLIEHGALFGLQLVQRSGGALKRGTVYATLARMESRGLVESEQEPLAAGAIGLPRRFYKPTALGKRVLRAWTVLVNAFAMEGAR